MYSCPTIIIGQLKFGDIAQLGERCVRNAEVTGSNPAISTMKARMISEELVTMAFFFVRLSGKRSSCLCEDAFTGQWTIGQETLLFDCPFMCKYIMMHAWSIVGQ